MATLSASRRNSHTSTAATNSPRPSLANITKLLSLDEEEGSNTSGEHLDDSLKEGNESTEDVNLNQEKTTENGEQIDCQITDKVSDKEKEKELSPQNGTQTDSHITDEISDRENEKEEAFSIENKSCEKSENSNKNINGNAKFVSSEEKENKISAPPTKLPEAVPNLDKSKEISSSELAKQLYNKLLSNVDEELDDKSDRNRACSERSDSGISDCSIVATTLTTNLLKDKTMSPNKEHELKFAESTPKSKQNKVDFKSFIDVKKNLILEPSKCFAIFFKAGLTQLKDRSYNHLRILSKNSNFVIFLF